LGIDSTGALCIIVLSRSQTCKRADLETQCQTQCPKRKRAANWS
jgi:hypothetical protein